MNAEQRVKKNFSTHFSMKYAIIALLLALFVTGCAAEVEEVANPIVTMETTMGTVKIELFLETMPVTAGNFKKLVEEGFYDGIIFHRVIPNFMIQGGDPTGTGMGDPGYKIPDEFTDNNRNERGTLSMANAGPNTGGSQFFINTVDNSYLDGKHPVFGKVVEGMDVIDAISKVETGAGDRPVTDVKMTKVTIA
jgi:peptidylprolyl isomerase